MAFKKKGKKGGLKLPKLKSSGMLGKKVSSLMCAGGKNY